MTPRVFVSQPQSHGQPHEFSSRAKFTSFDPRAPEEDRFLIGGNAVVISGSLPHAFNSLLARALDSRDAGKSTHLAMLHDDVAPTGPWITQLWHTMRLSGADLVSAVVPIKEEPPSRTSTAIGDRADRWLIKRYITLQERPNLPATFGQADVCGPDEVLLANTGCWLADLRRSWWDEFADAGGFNQDSRIVRNPDGTRSSEFEPEDWRMSRFLEARGARIVCTWDVPLRHGGWSWWANFLEDPAEVSEVPDRVRGRE